MTAKKEHKLPSNVKTSNFQVIEIACDNKENIDSNLNRQLDKEYDTPEKVLENPVCKEFGKDNILLCFTKKINIIYIRILNVVKNNIYLHLKIKIFLILNLIKFFPHFLQDLPPYRPIVPTIATHLSKNSQRTLHFKRNSRQLSGYPRQVCQIMHNNEVIIKGKEEKEE